MDFKQLQPVIESALRYVIAVLVGYIGIPVAQADTNTAVAVLGAIIVGVLSLWWSKKSDAKVVEQAVSK